MSLPEWLVGELTGGRGNPAAPASFREAADALRDRVGLRQAAQLAGVDRRTYQRWYERWNAGKEPRPRPGMIDRLGVGLRRSQLDSGRPGEDGVSLRVQDHGPQGPTGRFRTITNTNLRLRPGTMDRAADAWVKTGDANAAAAAFIAGIPAERSFYARWLAPDIAARDAARADLAARSAAGNRGTTHSSVPGDGDDDGDDGDELDSFDAYDEFFDEVYEDFPEMDDRYKGEVQ